MKVSGLSQLKSSILRMSRVKGLKAHKYFVDWYSHVRSDEKAKIFITDGGDGGIDLVIELRNTVVLVQSKFGSATLDNIRSFGGTIEKWKHQDRFEVWLKSVRTRHNQEIYRNAYKAYRSGKELAWEFVSLSASSEVWAEELADRCLGANPTMRAEQISSQYLVFLYELEKIGHRPGCCGKLKSVTSG